MISQLSADMWTSKSWSFFFVPWIDIISRMQTNDKAKVKKYVHLKLKYENICQCNKSIQAFRMCGIKWIT